MTRETRGLFVCCPVLDTKIQKSWYWQKSKLRSDRETHSKTTDLKVEGRKLFSVAHARDIAKVTFITILESIFSTSKI